MRAGTAPGAGICATARRISSDSLAFGRASFQGGCHFRVRVGDMATWNRRVLGDRTNDDFKGFNDYLKSLGNADRNVSQNLEKTLVPKPLAGRVAAPIEGDGAPPPPQRKKKKAQSRRRGRGADAGAGTVTARGRSLPPRERERGRRGDATTPARARAPSPPRSPLPSPSRFAVERPLDYDVGGGDEDADKLARIDERSSALRREMGALARQRHRIEARAKRRSASLPPRAFASLPPPPPASVAENDLAPRRAVDVVEHVLLDVIVNELLIEVELEMIDAQGPDRPTPY